MPHSGKNINVRPSRRNDGDPGITEPLPTDRGLGKDVAKKSGEDKKLLCARIVDTPRRRRVSVWYNPLFADYQKQS